MDAYSYLHSLRQTSPLIHNMTNQVVANFVANGLLSLGASPIMAYAEEEVAEITALCHATALNIGTITSPIMHAMLLAGAACNEMNHPLIFDPVGVGASDYRKTCAKHLLQTAKMTLIRGNAGEIATLCDVEWSSKGVDAGEGVYDLRALAETAANKFNCFVAISGETDWVSNGKKTIGIQNGQPLMTQVTGMGCLLTAVSAAFLAIENSIESVVAAHCLYGIAGDHAYQKSQLPGLFQMHFIDQLNSLSKADNQYIKIIE